MQTEPITIGVDARTAGAFRSAPPQLREELEARVREMLRLALMSKDELADEFARLTAETRAYALSQGLTDEKLEALLAEDD